MTGKLLNNPAHRSPTLEAMVVIATMITVAVAALSKSVEKERFFRFFICSFLMFLKRRIKNRVEQHVRGRINASGSIIVCKKQVDRRKTSIAPRDENRMEKDITYFETR